MNDAHPISRSSRLAPLVLRLGIAAILGYGGLRHFGVPGFSAPATPAAPTEAASPITDIPITDIIGTEALPAITQGPADEVKVRFVRQDVIAVGELLAAAALTLGWFTRLCAMGMLAFVGAVSYAGLVGAGDSALLQFGADIFQQNGHALALLAVASVSMLISGCGCLGVDKRRAARKALIQSAKP
jgi:uncharacterized membrane protein YphA (DoxX/SURF4 family)